MEQEILSARRAHLLKIIKNSLNNSEPHSIAFALRILGKDYDSEIIELPDRYTSLAGGEYGGYPLLACLGFEIGAAREVLPEYKSQFLGGIQRLKSRSPSGQKSFLTDDVAILGIADGLTQIKGTQDECNDIEAAKNWLIEIIDRPPSVRTWTYRLRNLAGDLLDRRGRLRVPTHSADMSVNALEKALRSIWPENFSHIPILSKDLQHNLLKQLLTVNLLQTDDLEKNAVLFKTLDLLVDYACEALFPGISDVSRILKRTEHSFKRWVWEDKATRKGIAPAKWLIDKEQHVQSFLWAILYPIYGPELVDETYLPSWGNVQPRFDLGIVKLKLIIEVKYARSVSNFKEIEEQVAGDLGLYFKDTTLFNRMIVFIYDDCDQHHPEKYDSLRNALMKREQIEDVIIIRRPGMIPSRVARKF